MEPDLEVMGSTAKAGGVAHAAKSHAGFGDGGGTVPGDVAVLGRVWLPAHSSVPDRYAGKDCATLTLAA